MQIFINDQPIDYKLEKEIYLEEVYQYLEKEIAKFDRYIIDYDFTLNQNVNEKYSSLKEIPINSVEKLFIYTGDIKELLFSSFRSLYEYIDQIGSFIYESEEVDTNSLKQIKEGVLQIENLVMHLLKFFSVPYNLIQILTPEKEVRNFKESFENFINLIELLTEKNFKEFKEKLLDELRVLRVFASKNMYSIFSEIIEDSEVLELVQKFESNMDSVIETLSSVNAKFQIGREKEAIEMFLNVLDNLDSQIFLLLTAIQRNKQNFEKRLYDEIEECFKNFIKKMEQLADAFARNDLVEIGDIIEYEFSEELSKIKKYLPEVKKILIQQSYQKK